MARETSQFLMESRAISGSSNSNMNPPINYQFPRPNMDVYQYLNAINVRNNQVRPYTANSPYPQ